MAFASACASPEVSGWEVGGGQGKNTKPVIQSKSREAEPGNGLKCSALSAKRVSDLKKKTGRANP